MSAKKRILIVEDEFIIAMDIKLFLTNKSFEIIKIDAFGEDAVNTVRDKTPDLVLMDINLKGSMTGLQAAEEIVPLNIPVIFLTAQRDETTRKKIEELSDFYIFKPYAQSDLISCISKALNYTIDDY